MICRLKTIGRFRLHLFWGIVACMPIGLLVSPVCAQFDVPFQVLSGAGILDQLPPPMGEENHRIDTGMATLDGDMLSYSGTGRVRLLAAPDPMTGIAPFESALPFFFDFGNGDTIEIHYGRVDFGAPEPGMVQVIPVGNLIDTEWLATFNPVPGSGTGIFEGVIGGEFFMTAESDPFDPTAMNIEYSWSSDLGYLTFIPEPSSLAMLGLATFAFVTVRRRRG